MRALLRPALIALSFAVLAAAAPNAAFAQAKEQAKEQAKDQPPPQLKQIALTDKQIDGALAAAKEMDAITEKLPENTQPDAKVMAQLEGVAKKHGFASYDEYGNVMDNISFVMGGIDPATKKYVGSEAMIKSQITQVQADKKMTAAEKKQALDSLNQALQSKEPEVENKGNIDLVLKYYDKLAAALSEDSN